MNISNNVNENKEKAVHKELDRMMLEDAEKSAKENINIKSEFVSEYVETSDITLADMRKKGFITIGIPNGQGDIFPISVEIGKKESKDSILKKLGLIRKSLKNGMTFIEFEIARLME